jgi:twinkle protein
MTIVTGIPGSGKSTWVDALLANLVKTANWSFALFSPENWPIERHAQNLIEKFSMQPFDKSGYTKQRITRPDVEEMIGIINNYFYFLMPSDDSMTVEDILEKAKVCIYRFGVNGIVIDPWNELDHDFGSKTETQYISEKLGKIRRFARLNNVHIWIVAHPQKLSKGENGKYKAPTMYEISGGAHWRNKADVGICVHRPDMRNDVTEVYVQKVRFREIGKIGAVELRYARETGTYSDAGVLGVSCGDTEGGGY